MSIVTILKNIPDVMSGMFLVFKKCGNLNKRVLFALVAEMEYAQRLGRCSRKGLEVRILSGAFSHETYSKNKTSTHFYRQSFFVGIAI